MIQYRFFVFLLSMCVFGINTNSSIEIFAQNNATQSGNTINVNRTLSQLEVIQGSTKVLVFEHRVPELYVENQDSLQATPIGPNQILITGRNIGFSSLTISDEDGIPRTINIQIKGDVRGLEAELQGLFPESRIRATALKTGVILQGTAGNAGQIPMIIKVAQDYFPEVHNDLRVGDSQLIAIEVKVYEVSRTKLRQAGINWQVISGSLSVTSTSGNAAVPNLSFNILNGGNQLNSFLDVLERNSLAKLLDSPVLVAMNGRPAEFLQGGEIPFVVNQGLGQNSIEFRPFGTKLDVVPIVLGQNRVRLEVRAEISEPAVDLATADGTPGFRVRRVNTGVEMKMGHTLALAGDYKEVTEAETSGFPGLKNAPYIGTVFRRVNDRVNEIELVITMTPRYISEIDPSRVPPVGPGQLTGSPSDCELYLKGYIEVPRCEPDCPGPNGLVPSQPVEFYQGNTHGTTNEYLEQRPETLPNVVQQYNQHYPSDSVNRNNYQGYPNSNSVVTPQQETGGARPASSVPPGNWPTNNGPSSNGAKNQTNTQPFQMSSRRVLNR
ncbi:MAG TPA: pilus assembly protein N-terminal domain-containing protein [Pirellulaceae bacterium]|nr:pilus assembly protein N-terminal domain-containing protein [Pirellulaceae bacterium]HMP69325.1 pilus assembly protein N-terminal domain-containing protein [Pirellulaceae bacterium]